MAVTYYVALPFVRTEEGVAPGQAQEMPSEAAAIRRAEAMSRDAANAGDLAQSQPLDVSGFYASPFYGDLMNQEMFAAQDKERIPSGFLVPLPNKEIADAWNQ